MNGIISQGAIPVMAEVTGQHLFGLDAQLLFDVFFTGINVFLLCLLLSYLLFEPARKFLADRRERIANDLQTAQTAKEQAEQMRLEYEDKLHNADAEAEEILRDARKRGMENQAQIVEEAKAEAARVRDRAKKEIELEKKHAVDDVKNDVVSLASLLAAKVVSANIDTRIQNDLVEETIKELDEDLWRN